MRVTGLGHAGLFVETRGGTVLCDPWVHPAFFGSWFPFPDNRGLDWARYGNCDYLYVSHRHQDHFDPKLLTDFVRKDTTVLLPDYPTAELERDLRGLGFTNFLRCPAAEPIEVEGLRLMITPVRGPGDGPIGDSALSLDDGTAVFLDQNDSHPIDLQPIRDFGAIDAYFTQFSGAIWWPMVYDLPVRAKQQFAKLKRKGQSDRAYFYIDKVDPKHVFPMAGPPCFLDEDLFEHNGYGKDDTSIFTDQHQFINEMADKRPGLPGHLLLPGTVVDLNDGACTVEQTLFSEAEITEIFEDKWTYLERQARERQHEVAAEKKERAEVPADMFEQLKEWWEPLMRRAEFLSAGIDACVRFEAGDLDLVLDFPNSEVRRYSEEKVRYWFRTEPELIASNLAKHEVDWSNSLFLSMRFETGRIGKFNEYLYTFFKCLSFERLEYVEEWYTSQRDTDEDFTIGEWTVQRRCPHLGADLAETGTLNGTILTCSQHNWEFDLATGKCLSELNHKIRSTRTADIDQNAP